jgi:hypothetical protein
VVVMDGVVIRESRVYVVTCRCGGYRSTAECVVADILLDR